MNALRNALEFGDKGYRVFSLASGSKKPLAGSRGCLDATDEAEQIERWFTANPESNVGIACAGVCVLDCDPVAGSPNPWQIEYAVALEAAASAIVRTPRGGTHYYFLAPDVPVGPSAGKIAEGIDVRCGGGSYVVAPGSTVNGKSYVAADDLPDRDKLNPVPGWLLDLLTGDNPAKPMTSTPDKGETIPEGKRNDSLFRWGCSLRRIGLDDAELLAALRERNRTRCRPPLPDIEVRELATRIARTYEPDQIATAVAEGDGSKIDLDRLGGKASESKPIQPFVSFPTERLPSPIREYVAAVAGSVGCDETFVALPLLTALGAAIGSTRVLARKADWKVPAILWAVTIGESGSAKSPAYRAAVRFTSERQSQSVQRFDAENADYKQRLAEYTKAMNDLADADDEDDERTESVDAPERPNEPQLERVLTSDPTLESIAPLLADNSRGLLLARDELSGWFGSLDRYAKSKGGDEPAYLSMYGGDPLNIDRKTQTPRFLHVPAAYLSICGTIQPGVLNRAMGPERRQSGLLARFILTCPPRRRRQWSDDSVPESLVARVRELFDTLFEMEPARDLYGVESPEVVRLSPAALAVYREYFERNADRLDESTGDLSAAFAKLEETALRVALIVHAVRVATGETADPLEVDRESMEAGNALGDWFCGETVRCYELLAESPIANQRRRLVDWIAKQDGPVTLRHVQKGCRWLRVPGAAEKSLDELVAAGVGEWQDHPAGPRGGRPTRVFVLLAIPKPEPSPVGFGYADTADTGDSVDKTPEDKGAKQCPV